MLQVWEAPGDARVVLLDAGRATLELVNEAQAAFIDEIEVGRRVAGPVRVAFEVDDSDGGRGASRRAGRGAARRACHDPVERPQRPPPRARRDAADAVHRCGLSFSRATSSPI